MKLRQEKVRIYSEYDLNVAAQRPDYGCSMVPLERLFVCRDNSLEIHLSSAQKARFRDSSREEGDQEQQNEGQNSVEHLLDRVRVFEHQEHEYDRS